MCLIVNYLVFEIGLSLELRICVNLLLLKMMGLDMYVLIILFYFIYFFLTTAYNPNTKYFNVTFSKYLPKNVGSLQIVASIRGCFIKPSVRNYDYKNIFFM